MSYQRTGESRLIFGLPESVIDVLIPISLNVIFVLLAALVLWLMGKSLLTLQLAKGFLVFWIVTVVAVVLLHVVQRMLRVSLEERGGAFIASNVLLGIVLISGWTAFTALTVHVAATGASTGVSVGLWLVAVVSGVVAHVIVNTFHRGTIYALVNLLVVIVSIVIFGVWPGLAQASYGWFFNIFG